MTRRWAPAAIGAGLLLLALAGPWARAQSKGERETPRAAVRLFLKAAHDLAEGRHEALPEALACLDLSEVPSAELESGGRKHVLALARILELELKSPDELPDDPKGPPFTILEVSEGAIVIARQDGAWAFTAETVKTALAMHDRLDAARRARSEALARVLAEERAAEDARQAQARAAAAAQTFADPAEWLRAHVPEGLRRRAFLLEFWQWIGLAVLAAVGGLLHWVLTSLVLSLVLRGLARQGVEVDRTVTQSSLRPFGILIMAAFWWVGVGWLGLHTRVLGTLTAAIEAVAAFAGVWCAYRVVDVVSSALEKRAGRTESKFDDLLVPLVRKSSKVFVVAFGVVFIADTLDFSVSSLLAGLGLGGLAFALAAQDTVKNLFGSLTVVLDRSFEVGDWVLIDGVEGSVEEVGFRSTRIRTFYNSLITIPNAKLLTAVVDNMGARRYRRWSTTLKVTYDTPPERLDAFCEALRELVRAHPHTRKDYFQIHVNGMSRDGLDVLVYVFHDTADWTGELQERHRLILDILRIAARLGVKFAYPTQTLYLARESGREGDHPAATPPVGMEALEHGRLQARAVAGGLARTTRFDPSLLRASLEPPPSPADEGVLPSPRTQGSDRGEPRPTAPLPTPQVVDPPPPSPDPPSSPPAPAGS